MNKTMEKKIDFVVTWVDGSDPNWIEEKKKYSPVGIADSSTSRYRDWDLMRYWFRGVEKFSPWVNKIYFVTWGHYPPWLNKDNEKLEIINHKDYIPEQYLPTFNSHTIELNLGRIDTLEEQFVYFNDDMFLIAPVKEEDFFVNGIPRDTAVLSVHCNQRGIIESHIPVTVTGVINDYFDMKTVIKKDLFKWINFRYGLKLLIRTLCLYPSPRFPGFWQHHLPTSFLKNTFREVWEKETDLLEETCSHKYRTPYDVSQWLFREWQICKGCFVPRKSSFGKSFHLDRKGVRIIPDIAAYIEKQKGKIVVINDGEMDEESFIDSRNILKESFECILPEKSSFEK